MRRQSDCVSVFSPGEGWSDHQPSGNPLTTSGGDGACNADDPNEGPYRTYEDQQQWIEDE